MAVTVTFFSKYTEHQLVRKPKVDKPLQDGVGWMTTAQGVRYQFSPAVDEDADGLIGRLDVKIGQDKLQDSQGWLAPGEDPEKVRDVVEALRAHRNFGVGRDFWQASIPAKVVRARIRQALANLDDEAVQALMAEERAVNARQELLDEMQDTLDLIADQMAAARARAEAEQEAAPKAKAKPKAAPGA